MINLGNLIPKDATLALYRVCQRIMLRVPALSEMRLAGDKVMAFLRVWHYLARAQVTGDYLEFGVWQGMSFELSLSAAGKYFPVGSPKEPRFFAFDSFEGLPPPDDQKDTGEVWIQGDYQAPLAMFKKNIARAGKGRKIEIVQGFYDKTLTPELRDRLKIKEAAFINIDCDLYSSTLDALNFCTPLVKTGTIIFFDDWYASKGDLSLGEARAFDDWRAANPHLQLLDFGDVAIMGKMFLVNVKEPAGP